MHAVGIAITEYVSDDHPGWVRCSQVAVIRSQATATSRTHATNALQPSRGDVDAWFRIVTLFGVALMLSRR